MRRIQLITLLLIAILLPAHAQKVLVAGNVLDKRTNEGLELATVQLLKMDSTFVTGASTDTTGLFKVIAPVPGDYIIKASYTGFTTEARKFTVNAGHESTYAGKFLLEGDGVALRSAVVVGTAALVEQKADTTMFNAAAYRTPEGSTLEALVKQLPGVEVDDDGKITWNGKEVKEFLVNGKDFFKGDTKTAMKNLPVELVNRLKAYDRRSDYAEQTGIDDGEETTVLDIMTKRQFNESWVMNADVAYGTKDRYSARVFATRFTDNSRITAYGNLNNTNDNGFGGPRGWRGNSGGLVTTKSAGADFSWENGLKTNEKGRFEIGGNVRYDYKSTNLETKTSQENFLGSAAMSSFSNSRNKSFSSSQTINAQIKLKWNPDSLTNLTFTPNYTHSSSKNNGTNLTATFNADPFLHSRAKDTDEIIDNIFAADAEIDPELAAVTVNRNRRQTLGETKSDNANAEINVTRRFGSRGRNLSLRVQGGFQSSSNESFTQSYIKYFQSGEPASFLNQYSTTPQQNWNLSARLSYVEPLVGKWYAEFRYGYEHKFSDSDRSRYNLEKLGDALFRQQYGISDEYAPYGVDPNGETEPFPIGSVPTAADVLVHTLDAMNSQYATYHYNYHRASAGIRYSTKDIQFNASLSVNPEHTILDYKNGVIDTKSVRNVFNFAPFVRFKYKMSDTNSIEANYRGSSQQPSMTNLLPVVDNSDPLNVTIGNPDLKPAWQDRVFARIHTYNPQKMLGMMAGVDFNATRNSISSRMVYEPSSGVRYTRPENISGTWNTNARFMVNAAIDKAKRFTVTSFTNFGFTNNVGYISAFDQGARAAISTLSARSANMLAASFGSRATLEDISTYNAIFDAAKTQKNTTKTISATEFVDLRYRNGWFDVGVNGRVRYQHARADLQQNANIDSWDFMYGASANFNFDWGMSFSTDIRMNSRRGYAESAMNTNELVWNAQISQSFLKGRPLTVSLQWYDILNRQSNISRVINAQMRSDSWNNAINSYLMVHVIYRLNIFPSGKSDKGEKQEQRQWGPPQGGRFGGGMPPGGMPPGGGMPSGHPRF